MTRIKVGKPDGEVEAFFRRSEEDNRCRLERMTTVDELRREIILIQAILLRGASGR